MTSASNPFAGAAPWLYEWLYHDLARATFVLVEPTGLEPVTPALQRRCSAN